MIDATLSPGWQAFHSLQHSLEHNRWADAASFAKEEALSDALDVFASAETVSDAEISRRFHSHMLNRRRRNRKRGKLVEAHVTNVLRPEFEQRVTDAAVQVEQEDLLQVLKLNLGESNFNLLWRLAKGDTYTDIAVAVGSSVSALRAQACRARAMARGLAA